MIGPERQARPCPRLAHIPCGRGEGRATLPQPRPRLYPVVAATTPGTRLVHQIQKDHRRAHVGAALDEDVGRIREGWRWSSRPPSRAGGEPAATPRRRAPFAPLLSARASGIAAVGTSSDPVARAGARRSAPRSRPSGKKEFWLFHGSPAILHLAEHEIALFKREEGISS